MAETLEKRVHYGLRWLMKDRRPIEEYEIVVASDVFAEVVRKWKSLPGMVEYTEGGFRFQGISGRVDETLPEGTARLVHTVEI